MTQAASTPVTEAGKGMLRIVFYVAILFSVFQIITAAFSPVSSSVVRSMHVGFLLLLTFLLYPMRGGTASGTSLLTKLVGFGALGLGAYHWVFEADIKACFDTIDHAMIVRQRQRQHQAFGQLAFFQRKLCLAT